MIPMTLKHFNLFVDGRGFAGLIEELTLPKLTIKTEEYRGGGMDAPVEIDMGLEKLECEFTLAQYDPQVLSLFGVVMGGAISFIIRGALMAPGGVPIPLVVTLRGRITELDFGSWKSGEKTSLKIKVACSYYKLSQAGVDLIEIDPELFIRKINGVDHLLGLRGILGIV